MRKVATADAGPAVAVVVVGRGLSRHEDPTAGAALGLAGAA